MMDGFRHLPGLALVLVIAGLAQLLSILLGISALILAIALGIGLAHWAQAGHLRPGTGFAADRLLKLGIAFLGAGLSLGTMADFGSGPLIMAAVAVAGTTGLAMGLAALTPRSWRYGLISGGGVGICGTAAVAALGAALPRGNSGMTEAEVVSCLITITALSAVAMIAYPMIAVQLGLTDLQAGLFLGGTIHGVGQAIGAGYALSPETGDAATLTKLLRVAGLVPLLILAALAAGRSAGTGQILRQFPLFILGFAGFAGLRSLNLLPQAALPLLAQIAQILLLLAMAALGLRTRLADLRAVSLRLPLALSALSLLLMVAGLILALAL